jgi:hypothetical protein
MRNKLIISSVIVTALALGLFAARANAAATSIIIGNSTTENETLIQGTKSNKFSVTFLNSGDREESAELDLEVYYYSAGGSIEKVKQVHKNVTLAAKDWVILDTTLEANAPPGEYVLKAGIFSPDWKETRAWYNSLKTLHIVRSADDISDNNVYLATTTQAYKIVKVASQPNYFTGTFKSPNTPNTVLIDIELYRDNEKIYQQFTDNMHFDKNGTRIAEGYVPAVYTAGKYHWSVGIFTPGWGKLIKWYDSVESFEAEYGPLHGP